MQYLAKSISGEIVTGELEYDGLQMFIIERKPYGTSKVQCVPGTEKELNEDGSGKIERTNCVSGKRK